MLRKISLAAIAALALTAAAVVPASAGGHGGHGMGGHWGHHYGRFYGPSFYVGASCYKTVLTKFGPRRVNVCDRVL